MPAWFRASAMIALVASIVCAHVAIARPAQSEEAAPPASGAAGELHSPSPQKTPPPEPDTEPDPKQIKITSDITATFLGEDLRIAIMHLEPPYHIFPHRNDWLRIVAPGPGRDLVSLYQLIGLVRIDSPAKALEYVRLRTSPYTGLRGDPLPREFEVVSERELPTMPNYGLAAGTPLERPEPDQTSIWGFLGVLSNEGFQQGGFTKPTIKCLSHGSSVWAYQITRWTFLPSQTKLHKKPGGTGFFKTTTPATVQQIEETVTTDGMYWREEIAKRPPPKLPHTKWQQMFRF